MARRTVMLPLYVKDEAHAFAMEEHTQHFRNPSENATKSKVYKNAFNRYCMDYVESTTVGVAKNPYSPKIAKSTYDLFPELAGEQSRILAGISDPTKREQARERLRSIITNFSLLVSENVLKIKKYDVVNAKGASTEDQKQVIINQYIRNYVAILTMKALTGTGSAFPLVGLTKQVMIEKLQEHGISINRSLGMLKNPETRKRFIQEVMQERI